MEPKACRSVLSSMSQKNELVPERTARRTRRVADCMPGWPLEWVSSQGHFTGKTESLMLVHIAVAGNRHDGTKRSLLLTARDRRRRAWTAALTFEDGPHLDALEVALSRGLYTKLRDVGSIPVVNQPVVNQ